VDFRNTVVVMTSNLGSDLIQELAESGDYQTMKTAVMGLVGNYFRPEFINRIDESVVFHPLAKEQIRDIAQIQLEGLRARLREMELGLEVDDALLDKLVEVGFDPVYGARPLKRAIQQELENPLAQEILAGRFPAGATVKARLDGESAVFSS
jgi:ATP-dependent Clp protease ATP-binding subunit ClpB